MNESFRKLAILYFEGRITPNQECELFGFIAAAPENALQVRNSVNQRAPLTRNVQCESRTS